MAVLGYTGGAGFLMAAVLVPAFSTPRGFHPALKGSADLEGRIMVASFLAAFALILFMLGSSRIVFEAARLRIITGFLEWRIGRSEIAEITSASGLIITLADKCKVKPVMFNGGMLPMLDGRGEVAEEIESWRHETSPAMESRYRWWRWPCRRHWHVLPVAWLSAGLLALAVVMNIMLPA